MYVDAMPCAPRGGVDWGGGGDLDVIVIKELAEDVELLSQELVCEIDGRV